MCRGGSHPQRVKISRHQFSRISVKINQKSAVSFVKSAVSPSANSARGKAKSVVASAKSAVSPCVVYAKSAVNPSALAPAARARQKMQKVGIIKNFGR